MSNTNRTNSRSIALPKEIKKTFQKSSRWSKITTANKDLQSAELLQQRPFKSTVEAKQNINLAAFSKR